MSCAAMLTGLALAAVAPCLVGCNAFAELAENGTLMVLVPNYARQGETVPINVTFPDLGVRLLRESRVTALEFGPLVSARSLEVNDDGSLAMLHPQWPADWPAAPPSRETTGIGIAVPVGPSRVPARRSAVSPSHPQPSSTAG